MDVVNFLLVTVIIVTVTWFSSPILASTLKPSPALMLAESWQPDQDITGYTMSEKFDGVRAYWDGEHLLTRSGRIIQAPEWFTAQLPPISLDGELWLGAGRFDEISGLIRTNVPEQALWREVIYQVFDKPYSPQPFNERYLELSQLIVSLDFPAIKLVEQKAVSNRAELDAYLGEVEARGGEGVMLHRSTSLYQGQRCQDLLKVKSVQDSEGIVIAYIPGEGRLQGMTGSLLLRLDDGREIRVGSGLNDALRQTPPLLGTRVTFAYNGLTSTGLPRFARFLRIRADE
ncbi:DNA ligase [Thalassolituus sp.]|jgi:DNA ligase-1|uniref:DNA ligase n=1 Tax=Thalassolituus sp. TaxID=2030822 RepID=UPI002A8261B4|nr:DNA ligase [Thalassolituus sp.]